MHMRRLLFFAAYLLLCATPVHPRPLICVLTGPSSSGKTAVLRQLKRDLGESRFGFIEETVSPSLEECKRNNITKPTDRQKLIWENQNRAEEKMLKEIEAEGRLSKKKAIIMDRSLVDVLVYSSYFSKENISIPPFLKKRYDVVFVFAPYQNPTTALFDIIKNETCRVEPDMTPQKRHEIIKYTWEQMGPAYQQSSCHRLHPVPFYQDSEHGTGVARKAAHIASILKRQVQSRAPWAHWLLSCCCPSPAAPSSEPLLEGEKES